MISELGQEIACIGGVQFFWMIADHDTGGWGHRNLGAIDNLGGSTRFGRRWVLADNHF